MTTQISLESLSFLSYPRTSLMRSRKQTKPPQKKKIVPDQPTINHYIEYLNQTKNPVLYVPLLKSISPHPNSKYRSPDKYKPKSPKLIMAHYQKPNPIPPNIKQSFFLKDFTHCTACGKAYPSHNPYTIPKYFCLKCTYDTFTLPQQQSTPILRGPTCTKCCTCNIQCHFCPQKAIKKLITHKTQQEIYVCPVHYNMAKEI